MGFTEDVTKLSEQVRKRIDNISGEESTKMALIVPFLSVLGFDVYDPSEVIPEYKADFATKKAGQFEKVDYALAINNTIVMLVEAKAYGQKAEAHDGQMSRYFNGVLTTKVAIVTNGIEYRFFTDLRNKNVMDKEPFFIFNILEYDTKDIDNLKLFYRDTFDAEAITTHAEEIVYVKGMTHLVGNLLRSPSDDFIRFLVAELGKLSPSYEIQGRITSKILDKFKPIVKKSIQGSLLELMTRSLSQEMSQETSSEALPENTPNNDTKEVLSIANNEDEEEQTKNKIIITEEELAAFQKIEGITKNIENYNYQIQYKKTTAYFSIHLGKVTWWILRLYLSSNKKTFITRLDINLAQSLAPDFLVQEVPAATNGETLSKITITTIDDFNILAPLIVKCFEIEAIKHSQN